MHIFISLVTLTRSLCPSSHTQETFKDSLLFKEQSLKVLANKGLHNMASSYFCDLPLFQKKDKWTLGFQTLNSYLNALTILLSNEKHTYSLKPRPFNAKGKTIEAWMWCLPWFLLINSYDLLFILVTWYIIICCCLVAMFILLLWACMPHFCILIIDNHKGKNVMLLPNYVSDIPVNNEHKASG